MRFMQRSVRAATASMKKFPMIAVRQRRERGHAEVQVVDDLHAHTPSAVSVNVQTTRMPLVNAFRCVKRTSIFSRSMICSLVQAIGMPERFAAILTTLRTGPRS